jgi:hypothetical protein
MFSVSSVAVFALPFGLVVRARSVFVSMLVAKSFFFVAWGYLVASYVAWQVLVAVFVPWRIVPTVLGSRRIVVSMLDARCVIVTILDARGVVGAVFQAWLIITSDGVVAMSVMLVLSMGMVLAVATFAGVLVPAFVGGAILVVPVQFPEFWRAIFVVMAINI